MPIYYLLLCGTFLPGIFGVAEWGFKNYTKYEPGDMNLILTVPHDGWLNPSRQSNGKEWPDRENGCEGSNGQCIWTHNCGATSEKCFADIYFDEYTREISRDIAEGIKVITGALNRVKMLTYSQLSFSLTDMTCMAKEHEGWKREMFQRATIFLVGQRLEHPQCVYWEDDHGFDSGLGITIVSCQ